MGVLCSLLLLMRVCPARETGVQSRLWEIGPGVRFTPDFPSRACLGATDSTRAGTQTIPHSIPQARGVLELGAAIPYRRRHETPGHGSEECTLQRRR